MKKITILIVLFLFVSFVAAQEINLEKLRASHIAAMKSNGHAMLLNEKNDNMVILTCGKGIASALYGESISTAYMEKGDVKIYWYVEKIENGVMITFKVTIGDQTFSRSFKFTMSDAEVKFQNLDYAKTDSRISIDWNCLVKKIPGCITCLTNWICWLGCAGSAAWDCVDWREGVGSRSSDGFACPKCNYSFYYYAHYCLDCNRCFNASSLTCTHCYSQRWTNGKICSRCGHEYK